MLICTGAGCNKSMSKKCVLNNPASMQMFDAPLFLAIAFQISVLFLGLYD